MYTQNHRLLKSTKIISLRVTHEHYQKILLECDKKDISVSELISRKIAVADTMKETKRKLVEEIETIIAKLNSSQPLLKVNLRSLIRLIKW